MTPDDLDALQDRERSNWVRLRTLLILRWFAIGGQIVAILVATRLYDLRMDAGPPAITIGAAILANLVSSFVYPENKRLSEREASAMMAFDIVQLTLLLYLTGGLNNPFALLILAPVTIAATVLHLMSFIALGLLAIAMISVIGTVAVPLQMADGTLLLLPPLFHFGFWVSLVIGVVFLGIYARQVTTEMNAMGDALLATQLALAREQKLTDLGGVVAAAAHELGTPLATIKLVSNELLEDLADQPELREDALLIRTQADRCRDILHSMGRAGKDDLHLRTAPLETVVRESAEPHVQRGREVAFDIAPEPGCSRAQPVISRRPEIIHGLRNLIQNAVDFSETRVEIDVNWTDTQVFVRIADDGHGFPQSVIGRIGDPFVRRRRGSLDGLRRPGYEGMGLGLFIAKTLLERSGAQLSFANGPRRGARADGIVEGAIVTVTWPMKQLVRSAAGTYPPLGKNQPILE
ncbi:sensor histidine kinase RegB [Loktanella sp. M215]|uniref:sensor histidine kinase RegB n=1 Tax=Loktanella sp. M215 TaxID=2675431 RepID=UPI001F0024F4|nr:ActS/PrrB/RegB family redox-sensitive histidine kinase [Loktanella sp. M215]MBU2358147.1 ActS/PrrB/RegB family redox-sensitive histidine kinase [Alphaproteobacteria bacterium]MCF7698631.1 ActS/PrrB/RegB family redox-sensitive histidine kinase [Loktanella sp. M215]